MFFCFFTLELRCFSLSALKRGCGILLANHAVFTFISMLTTILLFLWLNYAVLSFFTLGKAYLPVCS